MAKRIFERLIRWPWLVAVREDRLWFQPPDTVNEPTRPQWIYWALQSIPLYVYPKSWGNKWLAAHHKRPGYLNQGEYGGHVTNFARGLIGCVDHGKTPLTAAITFTAAGMAQANHEAAFRKTTPEWGPLPKQRSRRKPAPDKTKAQRAARKAQRSRK